MESATASHSAGNVAGNVAKGRTAPGGAGWEGMACNFAAAAFRALAGQRHGPQRGRWDQ